MAMEAPVEKRSAWKRIAEGFNAFAEAAEMDIFEIYSMKIAHLEDRLVALEGTVRALRTAEDRN